MFVTVWKFHVRPGCEPEFEHEYGPKSSWVKLFRRGKGFVKTELYKDDQTRGRYFTLDRWTSRELYKSFRRQVEDEYPSLDRRCEAFTLEEEHMCSLVLVQ